MAGTGIGTFNDRLRDGVRGGGPFDENPHIQGFASGQYTDPNGDPINGSPAEQLERLLLNQDRIKVGLTGNLRDYRFVDRTGATVTGADVDYNGAPTGYTLDPQEGVTYVEAHDNETLFDALTYKLPAATSMADRIRMQTIGLSTTAFGQGVSFWHAGGDILRSKSLDRNSYDSGDWFNLLDFTYTENGFGRGLPPAPDNEAKWPYMKPLLADPALDPAPADIRAARRQANALLAIRQSTPLFHLGTAGRVQQKVAFPERRAGPDARGDRDADRRHRRRRRRPAAEGPGGGVQREPRGDDPDGGRYGRAAVRAAPGPGQRHRPGGQGLDVPPAGRVLHRPGADGRGLCPAVSASPESA